MKIDITIKTGDASYDISVENGQKISSTFKVLADSIKDFPKPDGNMRVYKLEDNQLLDIEKTYEEQEVFQGQVLDYRREKEAASLSIDGKGDISYKECKAETYKVADFGFKSASDFDKLSFKRIGLLDCVSRVEGEDVTFYYDTYEKHNLSEVKTLDYILKYRFLVNWPNVYGANDLYSYEYVDDNIFFDNNMLPYIKKRTLKYNAGNDTKECDELKLYKAMIFYVFSAKYSFSEIFDAGEVLFEKEKMLAPYIQLQSVDEVREALKESLEHKEKAENKNKKKVSKIGDLIKNIAITLMVAFVLFAAYEIYVWNAQLKYDSQIIAGNKAYTRKDYFACIEALKPVLVDKMDYDTKYILASSYARTENMNREELQNVVERISFTSSEKELEYWIYLGRGDYATAEDTAKIVMSDQLLVYAYMKELDYLQLSTDISGEEKSGRIQELQTAIKELGEKYTSKEEEGQVQ